MVAYACLAISENLDAILSEAGSRFDREYIERWIEDNGGVGYFLRDESTPLDCNLFSREVFFDIYSFKSNDTSALFRRVVKN